MEMVISVLIVKPNEKPILKEIYNSKEEIARVLEIDENYLGNAISKSSEIYFPLFMNITYCIDKGIFPNTIIILSKTDDNDYRKIFNYTNMTKDKAFRVLEEINIKADEIIDRRYFFKSNSNFIDIVVNRVLHNKKISAISKALFVLIQRYNFDIFMSQITEHFKENIEVIEEGIDELIKLRLLSESRIEDSEERYFTINVTCLKEIEDIALTDYTLINKDIRNDLGVEEENTFSKLDRSESDKDHELLQEIIEYVVKEQKASTSFIQRKFRLGYGRAARLMDKLEQQGFVSPLDGSKPRKVLVNVENV